MPFQNTAALLYETFAGTFSPFHRGTVSNTAIILYETLVATTFITSSGSPGAVPCGRAEIDDDVHRPANDEIRLSSLASYGKVVRDETVDQLEAPRQRRKR